MTAARLSGLRFVDQLETLPASDWDALVVSSQPFARHAFLAALESSGSVGAGTGWQPAHALLHDADGRLQAACPLYLKTHSRGEYVFDQGWADACHRAGIGYYPKWLSAVPFTPVSGPRLLGADADMPALLAALEAAADEQRMSGLHINFTSDRDNRLLAGRPGWLARTDCQFHWRNAGYRDFQDFSAALRADKRKKIRQERERVGRSGLSFRHCRGGELSEAEWDFVHACYVRTYAVRGQLPYLTRAFFSILAGSLPDSIRVVLACQGQQPVAMAFFLVADDTLYGRYWGCLGDFDALHFETCFYQGIELALTEGLSCFNAGAQGEHKLVRGFEPVLTHSWHYLRHPGLRHAVAEFLQREQEAVQAYMASAQQALPFRRGEIGG